MPPGPGLHSIVGLQRGIQISERAQMPSSLHDLGGRQLAALHAGGTHLSPSHTFGGRQFDGLQTRAAAGSTENFRETVTSPALMTSMRWPAFALDARSKVTVALVGVALLIRIFETPVPGLTLIRAADTCDRSKKPEELMVNAAGVPAVTVFGVICWACANEINSVTKAVATRAMIERWVARFVVMIAAFLGLRTRERPSRQSSAVRSNRHFA
jgi:hypothetical protein